VGQRFETLTHYRNFGWWVSFKLTDYRILKHAISGAMSKTPAPKSRAILVLRRRPQMKKAIVDQFDQSDLVGLSSEYSW